MNKIVILLLAISLISCFEDVVDSAEIRFSNSSDLISYTETRTTLFNNEDIPQLVTVDEFNQSISDYYAIDIREKFDFEAGHIHGANNVQMKDVLNYLKVNNLPTSKKIIIISNTGQLASYASSLLIIAGYENIYSLDGGMSYWNQLFASELQGAIGNNLRYTRLHRASKPSENTNPPNLYYETNPKTIEEKVEERIQFLLSEPQNNIFITVEELDALYSIRQRRYVGKFVLYAEPEKFLPTLRANQVRWIDGPISSYHYDTPLDFTSHSALLTLPTDLDIVLYSNNGQQSAYITAYLNMLGYSARTLKYGKSTIMCFDIRIVFSVKEPGKIVGYDTLFCAESEKEVRDYPYEVGE